MTRDDLLRFLQSHRLAVQAVADEPTGTELGRLKEAYFAALPDGRSRESWPGITYVRVRPTWIRHGDFRRAPPEVVEFRFDSR